MTSEGMGGEDFFGPGFDPSDPSTWDSNEPWPCEAFLEWPGGSERCGLPAVFEVGRVADTSLGLCASHLGPVLSTAPTVEYPFVRWSAIEWIGEGARPPHALSFDEADERFERLAP